MSMTSGAGGFWRSVRQLPDRTPLRVKLITAVLALVIIALVVIGFAGVWLLRSFMIGQVDANLKNQGYQANAEHVVSSVLGGSAQRYGAGTSISWLSGNGLQQVVLPTNGSGNQYGPGGMPSLGRTEPGPNLDATIQSWLQIHPNQTITVPAQSGDGHWRIIAVPATTSDGTAGLVIIGSDVGYVFTTIADLVRVDLIVSGVVVLVLAVVGATVVRSNLRPLDEIEETAEEIAQGHLDRRVPERDPRTEVGRLGRSINVMLSQIESAFHDRQESEEAAVQSEERMRRFIADASHELRTPLTAIRGFAEYYRQRGGVAGPGPGDRVTGAGETAEEGAAGETAEEGAAGQQQNGVSAASSQARQAAGGGLSPQDLDRIMHRVEGEAARMGVLVEDLLLLARMDQQRPIERKPVDLLVLAADAAQDARMIAPDRQVRLTVEPGAAFLVLGDEVRLRQVVGNLVSNALTHTPDGTEIDVRLSSGLINTPPERPGGPTRAVPAAVLEVADKGQGLTPEQAQRVFERFYRADQARNRKSGGSGLGLAIVSALVTAHGGTASVQSTPGQGATFRVTLPLAPDAGSGPDAEPDGSPGADVADWRSASSRR